MKARFVSYLLLPAALLLLALVLACRGTSETIPVTLPTDSPPAQSAKPLSDSDRKAVDEFIKQQQAVGQEWDQFHQEFDQWRAGLTSCHRSSVQEALQDFAVGFNTVTEQARDLPRTSVTRELANTLIAAAEAEEAAFRQLRDRWQPNNISLFEVVEQQRSEAARAQKEVEDLAMELLEKFEKAADPEELEAMDEFAAAFDVIRDDWKKFHDDYDSLLQDAAGLDDAAILARLEQLIEQFSAVVEAIEGLPTPDVAEDIIEMLQEAAEAELDVLISVSEAFAAALQPAPAPDDESETGDGSAPMMEGGDSGEKMGQVLDAMSAVIEGSEMLLKEIRKSIKTILDDDPQEKLEDVQDFNNEYESLLAEWDAFHQRYNDWRRTEGGCDRTEVLQALGQFSIRIDELGRQVRDLPESGYLLPMYTLLVEAVEREEGAIRALRNSWQPFTVDAFIAVDQERDNANRLRREASIGLQELRSSHLP